MINKQQRQLIEFPSLYVFISRLVLFCLFFYMGLSWGVNTPFKIVISVTIVVLLIFNLTSYYIESLTKVKLVSLRGRYEAIFQILDIRICEWYKLYNLINQSKKEKKDICEIVGKHTVLRTRESIASAIKIIGNEFYKELNRYVETNAKLMVRVSYFQIDNVNECLKINSKDFVYFSEKEIEKINPAIFKKGDGSTAGAAWETGEAVFVSDINKNKDLPFKEIGKPSSLASLCCIPLKHNELFFGIISINCNVVNAIKAEKIFQKELLSGFQPVINQILLIELVRQTREVFLEALNH